MYVSIKNYSILSAFNSKSLNLCLNLEFKNVKLGICNCNKWGKSNKKIKISTKNKKNAETSARSQSLEISIL